MKKNSRFRFKEKVLSYSNDSIDEFPFESEAVYRFWLPLSLRFLIKVFNYVFKYKCRIGDFEMQIW